MATQAKAMGLVGTASIKISLSLDSAIRGSAYGILTRTSRLIKKYCQSSKYFIIMHQSRMFLGISFIRISLLAVQMTALSTYGTCALGAHLPNKTRNHSLRWSLILMRSTLLISPPSMSFSLSADLPMRTFQYGT